MGLKILNFNAYRAADEKRVKHFMDLIQIYKPLICTIQEIHIGTASRVFGKEFNVIINIEQTANDHIGVCTLVHKSRHNKLRTSLDHSSVIMDVSSQLEELCLITKLL